MKVSEYIEFVKSKVGCYYWYGTIGQKSSMKLFEDRKKSYPSHYKDIKDYESQIANPKQCFDCAGLVKSPWVFPKYNAADDLGATGLYGKCSIKGVLITREIKPGMLVFKGNDKTKSHVGIYIGDNIVVEAKGHSYGVIESKLDAGSWAYMAEYYNVDYAAAVPDPLPVPPADLGTCSHELIVNTQYDDLMLRSGPGTCYPVIHRMPKGSIVIWNGVKEGNWLKVTYQHYNGWAHKDYLKI